MNLKRPIIVSAFVSADMLVQSPGRRLLIVIKILSIQATRLKTYDMLDMHALRTYDVSATDVYAFTELYVL